MSGRFERLYELQHNLYSNNCPLIIEAGVLLKDIQSESVITQIKFHSVSDINIKAVKVSIDAFDITGKQLEGIDEYQYLDLDVEIGTSFGSNKAILMPDQFTRAIKISKITVVLVNGAIWSLDDTSKLTPLEESEALISYLNNQDLLKQYHIFTNRSATNVPIEECMGLWCCACGTWNKKEICTNCALKKETAFQYLDAELLQSEIDLRIEKEKEAMQARILAAEQERKRKFEEEARKLKEKEERKQRRKEKIKKTRKIIIAVLIALVVVAGIIGFLLWNGAKEEARDWEIGSDFYTMEVNGLPCGFPKDWEPYQSDDGEVASAEKAIDGKEESWYVAYRGQYESVEDYFDNKGSYASFDDYVSINVDGCDDAYICDEVTEEYGTDFDYVVKDYFVECKGSIFQLQYYTYIEYSSDEDVETLLSKVDFNNYSPVVTENYKEFKINNALWCQIPESWDLELDNDGEYAKGTFEKDGKSTLFEIEFCGEYSSIDEYITESQNIDSFTSYKEDSIDDCDEVYVLKLDSNDSKSVEYYVLCCGDVFNIKYYAEGDLYDENQLNQLMERISFDTYDTLKD